MPVMRGPCRSPLSVVGRGYAAQDDGEVLAADFVGRQWSTRLIPTYGNPRRIPDEPVHHVDVDIGPEVTLLDALVEQVEPHLALLAVAGIDEFELRQRRQPLGLVLV